MQKKLLNKECIITFVVLIVAIVFFLWIVRPMLMGSNMESPMEAPMEAPMEEEFEQFDPEGAMAEEMMPEEMVPEAEGSMEQPNMVKDAPYIDSQTGALLDGPGYEKGLTEGAYQEPGLSIPSNYYFLDDGAGGEMSLQHNLCSRSCCSEQWPTPFKMKYDPYVCQNKQDKFVPFY